MKSSPSGLPHICGCCWRCARYTFSTIPLFCFSRNMHLPNIYYVVGHFQRLFATCMFVFGTARYAPHPTHVPFTCVRLLPADPSSRLFPPMHGFTLQRRTTRYVLVTTDACHCHRLRHRPFLTQFTYRAWPQPRLTFHLHPHCCPTWRTRAVIALDVWAGRRYLHYRGRTRLQHSPLLGYY